MGGAAASAVSIRPARADDADACGRICFEAFKTIAEAHGFAPDFAFVEEGVALVTALITHPGFYGVVAERDGKVIGSNFLDERSTIAGIGPITIDPAEQNARAGRQLMVEVLDRVREKGFPGVRLLQAGYHTRSLSLYAKLGFEVRELCVTLQGPPIGRVIPGYVVRPATGDDLVACNRICAGVHGHDHGGEVRDAIGQGAVQVVVHDGRITGYSTGVSFFGHSVGESNDDLKALIGAATEFGGPGFLLPARNGELFRCSLDCGLRVVHTMTLMSVGLYNEPAGAFLPSVVF